MRQTTTSSNDSVVCRDIMMTELTTASACLAAGLLHCSHGPLTDLLYAGEWAILARVPLSIALRVALRNALLLCAADCCSDEGQGSFRGQGQPGC